MARAERQDLTAVLTLQDQLSGPLAAAKGNLVATENSLASVSRTASAAGTSLGGLGTSFGQVAKAGVLAFGAFQALDIGVNFFSGAIEGARQEEVGINRLTAALKANASGWDGNSDAVEKTIASRQRLGFADDELRDSLTRILPVAGDVNTAFELQNVAMDLARFKNISLADASVALTRVEAGKFRALADLGIVLKDGASQTEALAAVERVAAGQAEAFASSTAGAAARVQIAFHNLQEDVGGPLNDALAGFFETIENAGDFVDQVAKRLQAGRKAAGDFGEGTVLASPQVAQLGTVVNVLTEGIRDQIRTLIAGRDAIDLWGNGAGKVASDTLPGLVQSAKDLEHQVNATGSALDGGTDSFGAFNGVIHGLHSQLGPATDAIAQFGQAAFDAKNNVSDTTPEVNALKGALDSLPPNVDINVNVHLNTASLAAAEANVARLRQTGEDTSSLNQFGGAAVQPFEQTVPIIDPNVVAFNNAQARARASAAEDAARKAKQAAEELARAYRDKVNQEFKNAQSLVDKLFDALHARHLQAIDDAENLARKKHDAAVQDIQDNLKAEEAANAAPVNAAESALRERQQEQARRDLVERLQAAQSAVTANTDPSRVAELATALRDAREALENFDAQATIDRLKSTQSALDAQAQSAADKATAAADAEFAKAQAKADADRKQETIDAQKRKDEFEKQLAALQARDLKAGKTPTQIQADIDALEKRFGVVIDPVTGFHHIEDPLVRAIKDVKIEPPAVTVVNNQHFLLQVGPNELRLLASELQKNANPAASSGVRTGSGGSGR